MKNNKKIIRMLIALLLVVQYSILAAVTATVTGTKSLKVGDSGTIRFSVPSGYGFNTTVSNSNGSVISLSNPDLQSNRIVSFDKNYADISVKGLAVGESTITFAGNASNANGIEDFNEIKYKIVVTAASTGGGNTGGGNTGGGSSSGGSNSGGSNSGGSRPPALDNTEGEKAGTTLTPEQKAKAEAERKQKELEAQKLIPLVEKMDITSASDRMKDQLIDTIKFVDQQFEYSVTLPRKIDSVALNIPTPEGVTLVYPKEVTIPEGETSKEIEIKASKGEIDQVIKVTINKDVSPIINRENGGVTYEVYEEKKVEELFESHKFESIKDEKIGTYYSNEKVSFQMLTKDDSEVNFFMLDETQALVDKVTVMTKENGDLFFIDLENDRQNQINGNSRKTLPFDKLISFTEIDNSLVVQDEILAWDLEEGVVVEGTTTENLKSKFLISDTLETVQVIVPQVAKAEIDPLTIGLGAALVALAGTNFVYLLTKFIRKRKYNM